MTPSERTRGYYHPPRHRARPGGVRRVLLRTGPLRARLILHIVAAQPAPGEPGRDRAVDDSHHHVADVVWDPTTLNRRSWTSDSEIACTVVDERADPDEPAPEDSFPRVLLRTLVAEHLECDAADVPEDPHELFDAMVACADRLDQWYAGGTPDKTSGIRGMLAGRVPHRIAPVPRAMARHIPGHRKRREQVAARAEATSKRGSKRAARPPGRLRPLAPPELTDGQLRWAPRLYDLIFDPDGRPLPGAGA